MTKINNKNMCDTIKNEQTDTTFTATYCSKKDDLIEKTTLTTDIFVIGGWILFSLIAYFIFKQFIKEKAIAKARFLIGYVILSLLAVLILIGSHFIPPDYYANVITEIIGIALTVLIIDRVSHYLTNRNEKLHRDISLRHCKTTIRPYCYIWFDIYRQDKKEGEAKLQQYQNLEEFYMSDDFYNSVCAFNFANLIATDKTYAQYYAEKLDKIEESFQNILAKYASKLSLEDIQRLEFFGGGSYLYKVFRIMDCLRTVQISTTNFSDNTVTPKRGFSHINNFKEVSKDNFQKHFKKLLALIDDYNSVSNTNDQLTIKTLNALTTLTDKNANNYDW
jgi:hypothetical protein